MKKRKTVLAVDDNPVNLSILEEILAGEFPLKFAECGSEAIRLAQRHRPAFVLLDVMMPGIDGLEVCRQLRTLPGLDDVVIIMVSAKAMPSEQVAGLQAGADAYLTKPFDESELMETLRRFADGRDLDERRYDQRESVSEEFVEN